MVNILNSIKDAGNIFFGAMEYIEARRKYNKAMRYYLFFSDQLAYDDKVEKEQLEKCHVINCLNIAAVELKLGNFIDAKYLCNEVSTFLVNNNFTLVFLYADIN